MEKPKVVIIGCTGMLGAITLDSFVQSGDFDVVGTYRDVGAVEALRKSYPETEFRELDAEAASSEDIDVALDEAEWVVNAAGVIKPYIHDDNPTETQRAINVNSLFPYKLAASAAKSSAKVIQIATDCVYSGRQGKYVESDQHDAIDVYGKTKSLGEAHLDNIVHIRASIIGPELKAHVSLLDWFLSNPKGAEVPGYTNHQWNGVTTLHFAKIAQGIIKNKIAIPHSQHLIPGNTISKANLLRSFAKEFGRADLTIKDGEAAVVVDRTLATENEELNKKIWEAAGYKIAPTIEQMVAELAKYGFPRDTK